MLDMRCIIATDLGQEHNPFPINGLKWFIRFLIQGGLKEKHVTWMCSSAPRKLSKGIKDRENILFFIVFCQPVIVTNM